MAFSYKNFDLWKSGFENDLFWCQGIFFMKFDLKNSCKNEFKNNNEKSCSWSRNGVSHKIDFKAVWPRNSHADSVGVKLNITYYRNNSYPFLYPVTQKISRSFGNLEMIKTEDFEGFIEWFGPSFRKTRTDNRNLVFFVHCKVVGTYKEQLICWLNFARIFWLKIYFYISLVKKINFSRF